MLETCWSSVIEHKFLSISLELVRVQFPINKSDGENSQDPFGIPITNRGYVNAFLQHFLNNIFVICTLSVLHPCSFMRNKYTVNLMTMSTIMIIYARCWTSHTNDSVYYYRTRIRYDTTLHYITYEIWKAPLHGIGQKRHQNVNHQWSYASLKNSVRRTVFTCAQKLMPASLIYQN